MIDIVLEDETDTPEDWGNSMSPEDKALWLDALRSGKFTQAQGYLRTEDGFCCLGVLCAVKNVPDNGCSTDWDGKSYTNYSFDGNVQSGMMPDGYFGLSDYFQNTVADMNDSGKSFAEIADFIEKEV